MDADTTPFAELHCLSNFSFLRGASHPEELVEQAKQLGYRALAITDECSLAGVVRAHVAAREHGIQLIIGTELRLEDSLKLILLATDRASYGRLSKLITVARRQAEKGDYRLSRAQLAAYHPAGCLAIWLPEATLNSADGEWLQQQFAHDCWLGVGLFGPAMPPSRLHHALQCMRPRHATQAAEGGGGVPGRARPAPRPRASGSARCRR